MKYRAIIGGLVLILAVAGRAPLMQAAENCQDLLDNNAYHCQVTRQDGSSFEDCFVFNSASPVLGDFDLTVEGLGQTLGCSCETKKADKFKQTKTFLCVTAREDENVSVADTVSDGDNVSVPDSIAFEGKVSGKGTKIKKGQVVENDGFSYIFTCELDPSCAP
jgi:hypothetical protein